MDASPFYQFHNPRYKYLSAVTDGVNLHFLAADVFVHQHWLVLINLHCRFQIMAHLLLFGHDLHGSAAQYKAGAH